MEIKKESLLDWLFFSFGEESNILFKNLNEDEKKNLNISNLNLLILLNKEYIVDILKKIDDSFFSKSELDELEVICNVSSIINFLCHKINHSLYTKFHFQLSFSDVSLLLNKIQLYSKLDIINTNENDSVELSSEDKEKIVISLIEGIFFLIVKNDHYMDLLDNMENELHKSFLMTLLVEKIHKEEDEEKINADNESDGVSLVLKNNQLEKENQDLHIENSKLQNKNLELVKENMSINEKIKDYEMKYQDIQHMLDMYKNKNEMLYNENNKIEDISVMSLKIEISDLKSLVSQYENKVKMLKEEKERQISENKEKINVYIKENFELKEKTILYDALTERLEKESISIHEIFQQKQKNLKYELLIKEQEVKIKALKEIENSDRQKLFKKIEELNMELSKEKTKFEKINTEKSDLISICAEKEKENKKLNKKIENLKKEKIFNSQNLDDSLFSHSNYGSQLNNNYQNTYGDMSPLEEIQYEKEIHEQKGYILELEIKVKALEKENEELIGKINKINLTFVEEDKKKICISQKNMISLDIKSVEIEELKEKEKELKDIILKIEEKHEKELNIISNMIYSLGVDLLSNLYITDRLGVMLE